MFTRDLLSDGNPEGDPATQAGVLSFLQLEPGDNQRWSTWTAVTPTQRGPRPYPDWVVTSAGTFDTELGIVKSGKEADLFPVELLLVELLLVDLFLVDLFLVERAGADDASQSSILAAKRYRSSAHTDFHRSARYTEGRGMRNTRDSRAAARGTAYGRAVAAGVWAHAEFEALCRLHTMCLPVPYPVQVNEMEILMEFIGVPGGSRTEAALRLAQVRTTRRELADYLGQVVDVLHRLAEAGFAHGDPSPYNLLVRGGRIIVIDLPQLVEVVSNPMGLDFLHRDCANVCGWFTR